MEDLDKEIAKLYKIANTYVLEDFADDVMSLIESHTKKAGARKVQDINIWLMEHDQAPMDSSRLSIKANEWLGYLGKNGFVKESTIDKDTN